MSKTVILDIRHSTFPAATVPPSTYVVWRNLDPFPHSAETENKAEFYFNAGPLQPGEVSPPIYFGTEGDFPYRCRYHAGMDASVRVSGEAPPGGVVTYPDLNDGHAGHGGHGGHQHGLNHLHGFVTGGRSGSRLFMSHTPVLADPRHCYQVILQGSLIDQKHIKAYEDLRAGPYGDRRVQIFHEHTSLPAIAAGEIKQLPKSSFSYYPDIKHPDDGVDVPGLEDQIPVSIERVIHFHKFDVDEELTDDALRYLIYGDMDDVFIDHFMNRGPGFHSVAKLASVPAFWKAEHTIGTLLFSVPGKRMQYLQPKVLQRIAFVDNSFHIFWLPPSGLYTPLPLDPLFPRKAFDRDQPAEFPGGPYGHDVVLADGTRGQIEVARSLHFDVRLLNHGVFLPDSA